MRQVWYLAHAVGGDVDANVHRALDWLGYLRAAESTVTIIAPWIAGILSGEDDSNPDAREHGLLDCEAVVSRCDGLILCGSTVSSGMKRELARMHGKVSRLDFAEPPRTLLYPISFGIKAWEQR